MLAHLLRNTFERTARNILVIGWTPITRIAAAFVIKGGNLDV